MTVCGPPTLEISLPYATLARSWLAVKINLMPMVTSGQPRAHGATLGKMTKIGAREGGNFFGADATHTSYNSKVKRAR